MTCVDTYGLKKEGLIQNSDNKCNVLRDRYWMCMDTLQYRPLNIKH